MKTTELIKIPYGLTLTYKDIANRIGNPNGARAVGQACNKNKLLILIPCHRVISANKKLTGYAGGVNKKRELLQIESILVD